jgi:dihydroorotase
LYDLILRDATVVTPAGRQVADVCLQDGRIAYVGPHPPKRRSKEEINAIGRFLMPGVIDTAVHFDAGADGAAWEQESKAALTGGVTTVVQLPHGDRAVADRASASRRATRGAGRSWVHFGLWGVARDGNADEMNAAAEEGLVLGVLAPVGGEDGLSPEQMEPYLASRGVLGVHIQAQAGDAALSAATASLVRLARQHGRPLHLLHLSTATELQHLDPVRGDVPLTAGATPHHLFFAEETLNGLASRVRTLPPVRPEQDRRTLWTAVKRGRLDCVASDHHPIGSEAAEAGDGASGVPGSELLLPLLLSAVKFGRLNLEGLVALCCEGPARIFGLEGKGRVAAGADADLVMFTEGELSKVDAASLLSGAGWSPYADREAAAKPEMVILDGRVVARRGKLVADAPAGRFLRRERTLAATGT